MVLGRRHGNSNPIQSKLSPETMCDCPLVSMRILGMEMLYASEESLSLSVQSLLESLAGAVQHE